MARLLRSFRAKMILLLGLSMALSGTLVYALYKALQFYYHEHVQFGEPLALVRNFMGRIGDLYFFLLLFIPLVIVFFFLLTKPYSEYFRQISEGIHRLASGDFTGRVVVSSNDEFRSVAEDINMAGAKLQEAVKRGDFAESSKDQLVLNLAHDLRTPLTSVLGYLDLILRDAQLTPEQLKHYATIAYTKSQRLERLIEELFEITRLNYGMLPIKKEPLHLGELIVQLCDEMYPTLEANHLTARLDLSPDLVIAGDGDLLARVFENLLSNAIRYGSDGQYIDVRGFVEQDTVNVQITNYGSTIPAEDIPHLFEAFYTGDRARTHRAGSTGLGLFIARNIVERHNGTITVQSNPILTRFEVKLPRGL